MARAELRHGDYSVFLSDKEAHNLGLKGIEGQKVVGVPLEIEGNNQDGGRLKLKLQKVDFEDIGDGIRVVHAGDVVFVQINQNAWRRLQEQPLSGTRYNGQDKIHFVRDNSLSSPLPCQS